MFLWFKFEYNILSCLTMFLLLLVFVLILIAPAKGGGGVQKANIQLPFRNWKIFYWYSLNTLFQANIVKTRYRNENLLAI